jgi:extradiol dioxygenase family protein
MPARPFRIALEVGDLDRATEFYARLLATEAGPSGAAASTSIAAR